MGKDMISKIRAWAHAGERANLDAIAQMCLDRSEGEAMDYLRGVVDDRLAEQIVDRATYLLLGQPNGPSHVFVRSKWSEAGPTLRQADAHYAQYFDPYRIDIEWSESRGGGNLWQRLDRVWADRVDARVFALTEESASWHRFDVDRRQRGDRRVEGGEAGVRRGREYHEEAIHLQLVR